MMNEELRLKRVDGSGFYGEVTGTQFKLASGPAILLNIRDISARKKAKEDLMIALDKAEDSNRLKTRFLINMSHEIRTPMNGILGFLDLLKDMDLTMEERNMYISFVNKSGHRLMDTINDIIEMSKIETGQLTVEMESVNLNEMLSYLMGLFKPQAQEKKLSLACNAIPADKVSVIHTDKNKVQTILINILKNAVKFTRQGGIEIGTTQESDYLVIFVKDTGMGIPDDRIHAIFDRFVQADVALTRPYEGSGLGLSIARAYVEKLGGSIRVESEVDKGSTFYVSIPII
jgi:signal transduction histidine kinase